MTSSTDEKSAIPTAVIESTHMQLTLDETGTFRVCTPPCDAKNTASVLNKLNTREQELWSRRFTPSCIERIVKDPSVDDETKEFFRQVAKKNKEGGI